LSFYLDTSVVVALLTPEPHSRRADAWLSRNRREAIATSGWVEAELAAALAAKLRANALPATGRDEALTTFAELKTSTFRWLAVGSDIFEAATRFAGNVEARLRAGDALHLAFAHRYDAMLCTLDRRRAEAGEVLAIPTLLL
jgi:predicted nucleic acid-binding protein